MREVLISVVSPVYKAESIVEELVRQIIIHTEEISDNYEIILVDDDSPDNSWAKIRRICANNPKVKGLKLSRNFGQHYAISAGLKYTNGDWIVVMDCDLQDRPDEIPNLYRKALEGYQIVYTRRKERQDGFLKRLSSVLFNTSFSFLSGIKSDRDGNNFGIYSNSAIKEYNRMGEYYRSFDTLIDYVGFKKCTIDVKHSERYEGKSSYTLSKLIKLSLDIIIANTNKPLNMAVRLGIALSSVSVLMILYNLVLYLTGNIDVAGFTYTVISVWLVGGINVFVLGIIGVYIGKIFNQVKGRQLYIIDESLNLDLED